MNKKISTLFTAGLLVAGSLFSSAWAEELKIAADPTKWAEVDPDKEYVLQSPGFYNSTWGTCDNIYVVAYENASGETKIGLGTPSADAEKIVWKVSTETNSSGHTDYKFSSSYGDLKVTYTITENGKDVEKTQSAFQLGSPDNMNNKEATSLKWMVGAEKYEIAASKINADGFYDIVAHKEGDAVYVQSFRLYEVANTNPGEQLNELYNKKGFSFVLNDKDNEIENIFNQRIVALDVKDDVQAVENAQVDATNWGFPAGTYFTVSRPEGDWSEMTTAAEKYGYLKACTFIAISSTESIEMTDADRKVGKGFDLITISGEDLYKYLGSDKTITPRNQQVSVYNAAFTVTKAATGEYPYAINAEIRYLQADDAEGEDAIHKIAKVSINTIEHNKVTYLTTDPANGVNKIFKFGEAGIVEGIDLLKTDGPAVYNIKFVSGDNDKTELNKYLTIGANEENNAWAFFAKGKALSQNVLNTPAYQFIITGVDKENNITFTNRESGESFTAKLYTEEGDARSLAVKGSASFYIANINTSSYGVDVVLDENHKYAAKDFNDVEIELIPSTVVPFAGFCDAEDGTTVTMGFSKDAYTTSNILYAVVGDDYALNGDDLSDDIYDAAQFQLKKVEGKDGVAKIMRDYIYDNGNDGIAVEAWGDTVYIQKYTMEYIDELEGSDKFLTYTSSNGKATPALLDWADDEDVNVYVIRENADGSVEIMTQNAVKIDPNENGKLLVESKSLAITGEKDPYAYGYVDAYKIAEEATTIKTYLLDRPIYQSWENEGHVSLQSEIGNYLSMNDAYDGVLLNDAPDAYFLCMTDTDALVPSFYITKGKDSETGERLFLFNAIDSTKYQMTGEFDPKYQWNKTDCKVIFKPAIINATRDTLALTVKGEVEKLVADEENNETNVWGGLNRFKWQIIETGDDDDMYYIRQSENGIEDDKRYLMNKNEKLTWGTKDEALKFRIENVEGPVANETIADEAEGVEVIAGNGAVTIQGAAGKTVVITNILGKAVANTTLTSDNQTINVPAGIVVVTVDGEAVKAIVK